MLFIGHSLLVLAFCAAIIRLPAQQAREPYVLRQNVEEVLLYCTVVDAQHQSVMTLDRAAFTVREDGKAVPLSHVSKDPVPVSLALLLDDSTSMEQKRLVVRSGALDLLRGLGSQDEASITGFADEAHLDQDLTANLPRLQQVISEEKPIAGGTALFDTVIAAADQLALHAQRKQVVVVITDGKDNASGANFAEAIRRVQRFDGPIIYVIGLLYDLPSSQERASRKALNSLAEQTGGVALFPRTADEIGRAAAEISEDIHHQYTVAFHPRQSADSTFHSVTISVDAPGHLMVRTRKGYFRRGGVPSEQR